ncbi:MAG: hypothetical protein RLN82_04055, partial [Pseudomonadales bacterium]
PPDESSIGMKIVVGLGLILNRLVSPMMKGLPEIDADSEKALDFGLTAVYRDCYRAPMRPDVFSKESATELGELAVESPYSIFLERDRDGQLQWDFRFMGEFEHQAGLASLAVRVLFSEKGKSGSLEATEIDSTEYGVAQPGSPNWEASTLLAICAATTHLSLTRHFNYVHLVSANHWDVVTRNHLEVNHPIYRLLWPHIYHGLYTNYGITKVQMLPDGDFVNMFSFTHQGLMDCYDTMYQKYDITITDPEKDWERRGLSGSKFDCPSHQNLTEIFDVMHAHARRYICTYYESDAELQRDPDVAHWLSALDNIIPNGLPKSLMAELTREELARVIGAYIYEGITIHELAGTALWDYQLWPDKNPTRIYKDGRRIPLDVFQRVINANFALQLERAPLINNYRDVGLDARGRKLFTQFCIECRAIQVRYNLHRWDTGDVEPWKMEPRNLEISMNG